MTGRISNIETPPTLQKTVATVFCSWPSLAILDFWLSAYRTDEPFTERDYIGCSNLWLLIDLYDIYQTEIHSALWDFPFGNPTLWAQAFLTYMVFHVRTSLHISFEGFLGLAFMQYTEIPSRIRVSPPQAFRPSDPTFLSTCIAKAQDLRRFYHHILKGITGVHIQ